jgi:5'-nucleotidase/UDP-sugar diphosphatase
MTTRSMRLALIPVLIAGCGSSASPTGDAAVAHDGPGDGAPSDGANPDGGPGADAPGGDDGGTITQSFVILHTNDLHSHLMGVGPEADYTPATPNDDGTVGGFARLSARIQAARAAAGATPVLLLDAGDFMMGTPFHLLGLTAAAELVEMSKLKYDATTMGNHELDWGPGALAAILKTAGDKGSTLPVLATNVQFSATDPGDDALAALGAAGVLPRKLIKDVGGIKVGIFGLLGRDAAGVAPLKKPLSFEDIAVTSRAAVLELRQTDKVDVVIALSHSGTDAAGMGEDRELAEDPMVRSVGGIDVIVSGHTHVALPKPVVTGTTIIVQTGAYGANLGKLELTATKTSSGTTVAMTRYELQKLDDSVAGDSAIQADVDGYIGALDQALMKAKLSYKQPIGEASSDIVAVPYAESGLGDLVADAYLRITQALQPTKPPVLAIDASGDIRDDIKKGKTGVQWLADLFRVQPLGISPDLQPGFPLVTFYINGQDIKSGLELSAAAETLKKSDYYLQVAGLSAQFQPSALPFSRVKSAKIGDVPVDFTNAATCYKVVTNLYVASLLGLVETATGGLLSVKPKQEDCHTLITDLTTQIVDADPTTPAVEQLKEWQALIGYVARFPDTNGNMLPNIPASYGMSAGRITTVP